MLHLLFVLHNHQPLGNIPDVFRKAYEISYKPFIDVVRRHPSFRWALHTSGCLWEWLEKEEPGYIDAIRGEVEAGRLEILTGGMWEPIQPLLCDHALKHQVESMNEWLRNKFGVNPAGSWTTERIWEPSLAGRLSNLGIKYTLLDDSQFRACLPPQHIHPLWGHYRTEFAGRSISVFPIDEELRYLIPFSEAHKVVEHLEEKAIMLPENASITYGDDGEKFGMWPETYEWVYAKGWLDKFFGELSQSDLVKTTHPSEYLKIQPTSRERVYLPTTSYREMGIWALDPHRNLASEEIHEWIESNDRLRVIGPPHSAGHFRNFLTRYPESRLVYERVNELVRKIVKLDPDVKPSGSNDASPISRALWHVLRAQCNCAYWHGVFGGIYLNFMRFELRREIIKAEWILSEAGLMPDTPRFLGTFTMAPDGSEQYDPESKVLLQQGGIQWVMDPKTGQIVQACSLRKGIDVIDVLARRFEAYHATMKEHVDVHQEDTPASIHHMIETPPEGWSLGYGNDLFRRGCFFDRVVEIPPTLEQLAKCRYHPVLGNETGPWNCNIRKSKIVLSRSDGPWSREKTVSFDENGSAYLNWILRNTDGSRFDGYLLVEFNIGLLAGHAPDRYHTVGGKNFSLESMIELEHTDRASVTDEWTGVKISLNVPGADWLGIYPVKTLSRSEGGLEMNYQGTCLIFRVPFILKPRTVISLDAVMTVE